MIIKQSKTGYSGENPRSNYFRLKDGHPNILASKFVNECNRDFMNPTKNNWHNILLNFAGKRKALFE